MKNQPKRTDCKTNAKTIVFAGGGTAGHITPFIAVSPYLKKQGIKIVYIGSGKQLEKNLMQPAGAILREIDPPKFIRGVSINALKNAVLPFKFIKAVNAAKEILKKYKPAVIFSKGGYCALPVCYAAFSLKIPVVCHESDLTAGLANKLTLKKCDKFLTSFLPPAEKYGGEVIGAPMREELFSVSKIDGLKYFGITNDKPVLLITGGSQGSKTLNEAVIKNLPKLTSRFNVLHATGKGNLPHGNDAKKSAYKPVNGYFAFEFISMPHALACADVCVIRGGANTLFEVLYAKKPALCIPLKKGSRGDQIKNAEYFYERGAIVYADGSGLNENLVHLLNALIKNKKSILSAINNLKLNNGTPRLAEILLGYFSPPLK